MAYYLSENYDFFHAESMEDNLVFLRADGIEMAFRCDENGIEVEETEDYRDLLHELRVLPSTTKEENIVNILEPVITKSGQCEWRVYSKKN